MNFGETTDMTQRLCCDEFIKFFHKTSVNIPDVDAMFSHLMLHLPPVAELANISKIHVTLNTPSSVRDADPHTIERNFVMSEPDAGAVPYVRRMETGEKGLCEFSIYPTSGHVFDREDLSNIDFVIENIFIIIGRARMMQILSEAPMIDGMTGVPNMSGFMRFGNILLAKNTLRNYMGVFVNIKNFKFINQTIGARNGDKLLIAFTQAIRSQLQEDEIIARLGGDNFMILIKKEHEQNFLNYVTHIQLKVNLGPVMRLFDVDIRAGIYIANDTSSMNDIVTNANTALGLARKSKKEDIVYFHQEMLDRVLHIKQVSNQFRLALQNNEFVVYYQPKVDTETNTVIGCEALVRWIQNDKVTPPMTFIPILEEEGSVCDLDFYVFEQVCKDLRSWMDAGITPVRVSSNFSKVHLVSESLARDIIDIIDKYQVPPELVEIELTEMSSHEDNDALINFVSAMKDAGIYTSIDDFGTGYSSVNLLKDINVDVIKLDRSFLNEMERRSSKEEIVIRNIINMILELGMDVIAEGVETKGQADFLRNIRCHHVQGYLYDKPIPKSEFEKRLLSKTYELH